MGELAQGTEVGQPNMTQRRFTMMLGRMLLRGCLCIPAVHENIF
jgi:hypothetical protein